MNTLSFECPRYESRFFIRSSFRTPSAGKVPSVSKLESILVMTVLFPFDSTHSLLMYGFSTKCTVKSLFEKLPL